MKPKRLFTALLAAGLVGGAYAATPDEPADTPAPLDGNATPPAKAADADRADGKPVERIEVTGSSIKRISKETAAPVTIITRQDIADMGANTMVEVLDHITANTSKSAYWLADSQSRWSSNSGGSGANLRGLGPQATLTLLNGRRLSSFGGTVDDQYQFVNLDAIPADAIERIEVLADGASAIYGSDAIAGVVNIITKRSYRGLEVSGDASIASKLHAQREYHGSVSFGTGDLAADRYNLFGSLSFYQRDTVTGTDMLDPDTKQPDWLRYNPNYRRNLYIGVGSPPGTINPGTVFADVDDGEGGLMRIRVPAAGCTTPVRAGGGFNCAVDRGRLLDDAIPSSKRVNLLLSGRVVLSDALEGFTEVSASSIKFRGKTGPQAIASGGSWGGWFARSTKPGEVQQLIYPWLSPTNPYNVIARQPGHEGQEAGLDYRFLDDPDYAREMTDDRQYRIVTGLRGEHGDLTWESALTLAGTRTSQFSQGLNASPSGFEAAFGPYTQDDYGENVMSDTPAYQFGTTNARNRELLHQMFPRWGSVKHDKIVNWDGKITSKLGELAGGDLMYAVGANVNRESYDDPGSTQAAAGDIVWQGGTWYKGSRTTKALYGEILAPVHEKLELNFALRDDKYPGFKNHVVFKFGAKSQLADMLLLRGTVSQGFRAPSLIEQGTGGTYALGDVYDPVRCEQASAIAAVLDESSLQADRYRAEDLRNGQCGQQYAGRVRTPNPNLKPETANIGTVGFVFNPSKLFDVSADYFFISRRNEIVQESANERVARAIEQFGPNVAKVPGVFERGAINSDDILDQDSAARVCRANPSACPNGMPVYTVGTIAGFMTSWINQSRTLLDGFDLSANAHLDLSSYGKVDLSWQSTIKRRIKNQTTDGWSSNTVGSYLVPRVTSVLTAKWRRGVYDVALTGNYTGRQSLQRGYGWVSYLGENDGSCYAYDYNRSASHCDLGVGSSTYWTLNAGWTPNKQLRLDLNVRNLFGRTPRYDPEGGEGVNFYEDAYRFGRVVSLAGNYKF
ncbi:TonB-dependent receptor domain-containing protein [Chitinimonas koreensis]|uniref:TonB-dependent receptor domain-containing protein n=1 Tax=Chitinimonas koreensis TaxID=356302 RepID=UPI0004150D14|nr:TonB-dependent receptor [Chitinimonas koreensis]QNM95711.1 TonB-dependent receptor [Chitinimonas koreensis]